MHSTRFCRQGGPTRVVESTPGVAGAPFFAGVSTSHWVLLVAAHGGRYGYLFIMCADSHLQARRRNHTPAWTGSAGLCGARTQVTRVNSLTRSNALPFDRVP